MRLLRFEYFVIIGLFFFLSSKVIVSVFKFLEHKIGTAQRKIRADNVKFPTFTFCGLKEEIVHNGSHFDENLLHKAANNLSNFFISWEFYQIIDNGTEKVFISGEDSHKLTELSSSLYSHSMIFTGDDGKSLLRRECVTLEPPSTSPTGPRHEVGETNGETARILRSPKAKGFAHGCKKCLPVLP